MNNDTIVLVILLISIMIDSTTKRLNILYKKEIGIGIYITAIVVSCAVYLFR